MSPAPADLDPRPIGVFDSGIGGLTVAAALRRRLPRESLLYLGDTARVPYGSKSAETVSRYTRNNLDFLLRRGVKAVVVACNTASALALPRLEATLPVWGVIEPGARQAAAVSRGKVGVVGTDSTVRSGAYGEALRRLRPELEVVSRACPLLVPLAEEGWWDDSVTEQVAHRYLDPLLEQGIDTLVLGCTHYPLLRPVLGRVAGPEVTLVDSADAVAEMVAAELEGAVESEAGERAPPRAAPLDPSGLEIFVTDASSGFASFARRILGPTLAAGGSEGSGEGALTLEWVDVRQDGVHREEARPVQSPHDPS